METAIQEISQGNIFGIIILSALGYGVLLLIRKYIPLVLKRDRSRKILRIIYPIVELAFWIWVFYAAIPALYEKHFLLGLSAFAVALAVIVWYAWYRLRDYIAGIILRSSQDIREQEIIIIAGSEGKIIKFGSYNLMLETDNGEIVLLPYSCFAGKKIIKKHPSEQVKSFKFILTIQSGKDPVKLISEIKNTVLTQPWSSLKKDPQILMLNSDNDQANKFEITVFTPNMVYAQRIKAYLEAKYTK